MASYYIELPVVSGGGGGSGTVTSISVASANGLAGTVINPTTSALITLSTTITGILKGDGTSISAATPGTDYLTVLTGDVTTSGNAATISAGAVTYAKMQNVSANSKLLGSGSSGAGAPPSEITLGSGLTMTGTTLSASGGGSGTVTSVALTVPAFLSVAGSPITTSGTLAVSFSGTALPIANGGTASTTAAAAFNALSPMTTLGDIIYGGASGAGTRLAGNTTTTPTFLKSLGSGGLATAPTFTQVAFSDLSGSASGAQLPTFTGDVTNVGAAMTVAAIQGVAVGTPTGTTNVVFSNSPTLVTPTLGVASATSESITGTGGAGFVDFVAQSSNPSTPAANHIRVFSSSTDDFAWLTPDGFSRILTAGTLTASRTYTFQDANMTLVGTTNTQTLTNKTLTAPVIATIVNTGTLTLPTATDTLVARATTDTLSNKTLDNTTVENIKAANFTIQDGSDTTKQARFVASSISTGTTRSYTLPDVSDTLVTLTATQTLTNKTLTSPIIGTIVNTGTLTLPTATDTLVARTTTDTLTNKRITKRVVTAADATSVTPNSDNADITYQSNSQSVGTLTMNADTGTPTNGQPWLFKIKSTNVQTYAWNTLYVGGTTALPTASTGGGKIDYYAFIYDTVNSKWHFTGTATGF